MKITIIEGWAATLLKAWTVRFGAIWALLIGYFAAYPDKWQEVLAMLPEAWRPVVQLGIGILMFASIGGSRVVAQKSMTKPDDPSSAP